MTTKLKSLDLALVSPLILKPRFNCYVLRLWSPATKIPTLLEYGFTNILISAFTISRLGHCNSVLCGPSHRYKYRYWSIYICGPPANTMNAVNLFSVFDLSYLVAPFEVELTDLSLLNEGSNRLFTCLVLCQCGLESYLLNRVEIQTWSNLAVWWVRKDVNKLGFETEMY